MTKPKKISSKSKIQVNTAMMMMKMKSIKLVTIGEKGGVGKTWLTLILIEFLRSVCGKLPVIIDMDTSTPNIAKIYQKDNYNSWSNIKTDKNSDEDSDRNLIDGQKSVII
jgi:cellulose biosynthesis protein BcsQ